MQNKIAVFDSGVGGLVLLKRLQKLLPYHDFLYFADNLNVPYGNKTQKEIESIVSCNMQKILSFKPQGVFVACNTATSLCVADLQTKYPSIIIDGILPDVANVPKPCIVFCTKATADSKKIIGADKDTFVFPLESCADMIEKGCSDVQLKTYLEKVFSGFNLFGFKSIFLGCTHYVHKKQVFESFGLPVFDNVGKVAQSFANKIKMNGLNKKTKMKGKVSFFLSDNKEKEYLKYLDFYAKL
ncbi:MAG: aspartate/glutamate racemase family protein [Clostridia bacterium]|nr:aspartate/glutamate racemase family protein [Clostridia bacterium]